MNTRFVGTNCVRAARSGDRVYKLNSKIFVKFIKMHKNTIIIGGGITGISAAYHLKKKYAILEKNNSLGGLAGSIRVNGFTFDYTGHLLHLKTSYVKSLIFKLLKENLLYIKRNSKIYFDNKFSDFPFQVNTFNFKEQVRKQCLFGFIDTYYQKNNSQNFFQWCLNTFGKGISKYFLFPYNKKLWVTDLKKLSTDWVSPFVVQPDVKDVVQGCFYRYSKDFGYNPSFFYPRYNGMQSLIDGFSNKIENVYLNCEVYKVNLKKRLVFTNKGTFEFKNLINTMPLKEFILIIEDLPHTIKKLASQLKYLSVVNINIGVESSTLPFHWIYFPDCKLPFYRIGVLTNFSKYLAPQGCSSFYIEVSFQPDKLNNFNLSGLVCKVIDSMKDIGLVKNIQNIKVINILRIPYAYIIHSHNRKKILNTVFNYLNKNSVYSIGRFGGWRYSYIEENILDGKKIAEKLA